MSLWLGIAAEERDMIRRYEALDVVEANSENEAFYKLMHMQIYPAYVIELPDDLVTYDYQIPLF